MSWRDLKGVAQERLNRTIQSIGDLLHHWPTDRKLVQRIGPVRNRPRPLLTRLLERQIQHLFQSFIVRERLLVFQHLAQRMIQALDRDSGVE